MLEVLEAGALTTVQDAGRAEYTDLGVPIGGACDPWSLAVANILQGNDPAAPALEVTLPGVALVALRTCTLALAGADLGAVVPEELRRLVPGRVHLLRAGTHLRFEERRSGARAYVALAGGIAVPFVLGSAATCLAGGFGGVDGRSLRARDRLVPSAPDRLERAGRRWPDDAPLAGRAPGDPDEARAGAPQTGTSSAAPLAPPGSAGSPVTLRVVEGPHAGLDQGALESLCSRTWEVGPDSDRTGLRLLGPVLTGRHGRGELVSTGMVWGAVQVPPDGSPIVLLADAPPVGGYPVPAVVIRADLPILGQLAPGDRLRLRRVPMREAQELLREQRSALELAAARLARADPWEDLAAQAGG